MDLANPFTGLGQRDADQPRAKPPAVASAAGRMRWVLGQLGPLTAAVLAKEAGLAHSGLVGALLKHDITTGRVTLCDGVYSLDPDFDESERADVMAAAALLRRKGYTVRKPT